MKSRPQSTSAVESLGSRWSGRTTNRRTMAMTTPTTSARPAASSTASKPT